MAVKPISAPVVIRRSLGASTTTIRETQLDLGIRPAQAELAEILKVTLSRENDVRLTGAIASGQDNISCRQRWVLSTQTGLTTIPDNLYEDGCFWEQHQTVQYVAAAAAVSAIAISGEGQGYPMGVAVQNPPIIVAANTISFYDIAEETDAVATYSAFGFEVMYRLVQVDAATLAALLARADLFL